MFIPKTVIFEEKALEYVRGKEILKELKNKNIEIKYSKTGRVTGREIKLQMKCILKVKIH